MFFSIIKNRRAQMVVVDRRVRLLSEVINYIRAVKLYAYEVLFGDNSHGAQARGTRDAAEKWGQSSSVHFLDGDFVPTVATVCESVFDSADAS